MTRRGPHEGSVYQRKDGRWVGSLHIGYEAGRRRRRSFYGVTRREVQEQLARAIRDLQDGLCPGSRRLTVTSYLTEWLTEAQGSVRPSTARRYEQIVRNQLIPQLGRVVLSQLTPGDVEAMMRRLMVDASPRSVSHVRAVLRSSLARAVRHGLLSRNVASLATPPRVEHREMHTLTPDEVKVLLSGLADDRYGALYVLAVALGMRQGELLGLQWSDVDFDAGMLHVRGALQRVDGKLRLVETKTARSRRSLPLPSIAVTALHEQRRRQLAARLLAGSRWTDTNFVFTASNGAPFDGTSVTHAFQATLSRLGLPRVRFHDLRHTAASLLLAQGTHPRVVMELLGHSQISLTLGTYSHVIPALQREAANTMDALLGS